MPAGGLKPPASARPAPGGRFPPAGSGAGLCRCGLHGSLWQRSAGAGETHAFPVPARTDAGRSESEPPTPLQWQGPSPLPQRSVDPWPAGGPKPPASARRVGRRPSAFPGPADLRGTVPRGRGKRMRFPFPPEEGADDLNPNRQHRCHGRGHRPCHRATLIPGQPGAQSPRPAPAPPPAGASRPPGRALASAIPGPAGLRGTVPHGRGNAVRFLIPPAPTKALSPLSWQGPSPLPQRCAASWPAGGQSPRPAPAPPPAGASRPPGRALASVGAGGTGLGGSVPRGRGKRCAFPVPARTDKSTFTAAMAGAITPATALR